MFDKIRDALSGVLAGDAEVVNVLPDADNKKLCAAVLMVQIIVADGKITEDEEAKLLDVLQTHYDMDAGQAHALAEQAKVKHSEAIDLYSFTSVLKNQMEETERLGLIEDLWEMVYADGKLHEFEDNLVWRLAELLNISSDRRMALKKVVRERAGA